MRILTSDSHEASWNLAAEEILLQGGGVPGGVPGGDGVSGGGSVPGGDGAFDADGVLFLYVNRPTVVLGCNQAWQREVQLDFCRQNGIAVARRISGGGAVYQDEGTLNFCFAGPRRSDSFGPAFLQPVVTTLHEMGFAVTVGPRKDLWLNGRKVSGTAAHFSRERALQHGTLLFDTRLDYLHASLTAAHSLLSADSVLAPAAGVASVSGEVSVGSEASVNGEVSVGSEVSVGNSAPAGGEASVGSPAPVSGEVLVGGEASVGSSALVGSEALVNGVALTGVTSVPSPVMNLRESRPESFGGMNEFLNTFAQTIGGLLEAAPTAFSPEQLADICRLQQTKYSSPDWTFRK